MNLYRLAIGVTEHFVVAKDEDDAYKQGTDPEQFTDIHYLPFTITEIKVPGYSITVTKGEEEPKDEPEVTDEFSGLDKPALIEFVKANSIEHKHNWGVERLRDAARAWKAAQ